jgi:hypothetical protein
VPLTREILTEKNQRTYGEARRMIVLRQGIVLEAQFLPAQKS